MGDAATTQGHQPFASLRGQLLRSHFLVALIGVVLVAVAFAAGVRARTTTLRLTVETEPALSAATRAVVGIERAAAATRALLMTADATYADERQLAFTRDVDPALAELRGLSPRWAPDDQRALAEATAVLADVRSSASPVEHALSGMHRAAEVLTTLSQRQATHMRVEAARLALLLEWGLGVLLALLASGGALALAVSIRTADRITGPLAALADATGALAAGTLHDDLPVTRDDEVGRLTRAFNRMRASVSAAERALGARVEEAIRAHDALRAEVLERAQAEWRFRQMLEATPDAILIVDPHGTIALVNAGSERLFGRPRAELVGTAIATLVPHAFEWACASLDGVATNGAGKDAAANGAATTRGEPTLFALRADGGAVPVDIRVNPLVIDGRTLLAIAVRDVTEREGAAQALRELNIELEQRVAARTAELRRSNEELERFAAVASHELQAPLRMVASYTRLLANRYRERLDDDGREFIEYALDGAERMQRLLRDLLAYARVHTRARPVEPVDAAAILDRVLANLRLAIAERSAVVTSDPLPRLPFDGSQLGQVLQNLVHNALKFAGDEPPRVHVSAEHRAGTWIVSVRDHGIGVAPEHAERVFALFERVRGETGAPGSGIGLALCKKIVEHHDGRIWVEPAPDGGAIFRFSVPAPAGRADTRPAAAPPAVEAEQRMSQAGGAR